MMKMIAAALAAVLLAVPASAQTSQAKTVASATDASIDSIVANTLPDGMLRESVLKGFDVGFDAKATQDPQFKTLTARYPGIDAALKSAGRAEVSHVLSENMPSLRTMVHGMYAARFAPAELKTLADFYSSPTGRRMVAGASQAATDTAIAQVRAGGAGKPDMTAINQNAGAGALRQLQGDDMPVLMVFGASTAAQKAKAFAPDLQQAVMAWMGKLVADDQGRIMAAVKQTTVAYMKAHPAKAK